MTLKVLKGETLAHWIEDTLGWPRGTIGGPDVKLDEMSLKEHPFYQWVLKKQEDK